MPASTGTEPLLLIPGLLCSPDLFAAEVVSFSGERAVVVGDQTRSDTVAGMAAGILATAPARFAMLGLSMGGYVAFEIFRQAPERVSRVAFLDTSARPDTPDRSADRRRLIEIARSEGVRKIQSLLLPRLLHPDRLVDTGLVERVLAMADWTGLDAFVRQQEAIIGRPDSRPMLDTIRCPALVLTGAQDLQTPPEIAREIAERIPGSRLVIVPDCGHLSTMERPEAVDAELGRWLAA